MAKLLLPNIIQELRPVNIPKNISTISKETIANLICDKMKVISVQPIAYGSELNSLVYLFECLFQKFKSTGGDKYGLVSINNDFFKYFGLEYIASGAEGMLFSLDTNYCNSGSSKKTNKFVLKIFLNTSDIYASYIIPYYLSLKKINTLRYTSPCFMYTYGAFISNYNPCTKNPKLCKSILNKNEKFYKIDGQYYFNIYEYVEGSVFSEFIGLPECTKEVLASIILQLFVSLEYSQKKIGFCHYDLHSKNVIIKKAPKNYSYQIPLDNKLYVFKNISYIPIMIDYGYACATRKENNKTEYIGIYDNSLDYVGLYNYMIPGVDIYKFIVTGLDDMLKLYSKKKNFKQNVQIFYDILMIYGDDDPYHILKNKQNIKKAMNKFCNISESKAAAYTPLMLVDWFEARNKSLVKNFMDIIDRNILEQLYYQHLIFNSDLIPIINTSKDMVAKLSECVNKYNHKSYIILHYTLLIFKNYNKIFNNKYIKEYIQNMEKYILSDITTDYINNDMEMLYGFFSDKALIELAKKPLFDNIENKLVLLNTPKASLLKVSKSLLDMQLFMDKITPYLELLYLIRETQLNKLYEDWIDRFVNSDIYTIYNKNIHVLNRYTRWKEAIDGCIAYVKVGG